MSRPLLATVIALVLSCAPAYLDTVAPTDAAFTLSCVGSCGAEGNDGGIILEVSFSGGARQYALCCAERQALRARLQTIADMWCDGLPVADKTIGALTVGTTTSEITGKRGARIDDGEGFVAFNCDDWLGQLTAALGQSECCGAPSSGPPSSGAPSSGPPSSGAHPGDGHMSTHNE